MSESDATEVYVMSVREKIKTNSPREWNCEAS